MTAPSWRTVALGAPIALAMPLLYLVLAYLFGSGLVPEPTGPVDEALSSLGLNATIGSVLALLGLSMIGRGANLRSAWAWIVLVVLGLPVIAFVWFLSYATLGGATGSPF